MTPKHGARYMRGWQVDELRKMEGDSKTDEPIRSFQAKADEYKRSQRSLWPAIFIAIALWALIHLVTRGV